ncbi:MAG: hypothetical protein QOE76_2007 [Frankiales bacterium]|nr:hypothetical protein [Frankiales bacterium]
MKTILVSAPSVGLTSPVSALGASWQGYLAPAGALGFSGLTAMTGLATADSNSGTHVASDAPHAVAGVVAATVATAAQAVAFAVPFAAATVAAVAGDQQVVTAPKQADKPIDPRNDASPLGVRPGAPPS